MKWVEFASNFPSEPEACHAALKGLNEDLAPRAVLLGGLRPSEADIVVFSTLNSFMGLGLKGTKNNKRCKPAKQPGPGKTS